MRVILLKDIAGLGRRFEVKTVKDGYGRNFLLKGGLALPKTAVNEEKARQWQKEKATAEAATEETSAALFTKLPNITLKFKVKSNEQGHLFVGLHREDIAEEFKKQIGLTFNPDWLKLEKPLKAVGEYYLPIAYQKKSGELKVIVESQTTPRSRN